MLARRSQWLYQGCLCVARQKNAHCTVYRPQGPGGASGGAVVTPLIARRRRYPAQSRDFSFAARGLDRAHAAILCTVPSCLPTRLHALRLSASKVQIGESWRRMCGLFVWSLNFCLVLYVYAPKSKYARSGHRYHRSIGRSHQGSFYRVPKPKHKVSVYLGMQCACLEFLPRYPPRDSCISNLRNRPTNLTKPPPYSTTALLF